MIGGVVGYTYQAENLCPTCTIKAMRAHGIKVQRGKAHEEAIRRAAEKLGIDYDDQHSYDSDNFPKPVTEQQCETELTEVPNDKPGTRHAISDERCTGDKCGKWLILGEKSPSEAGLTRWVHDSHELPRALAKLVAAILREWGLSHPEFITEDNIKQAAAQHPHDWVSHRFVDYPKTYDTVLIRTPGYDTEECVHCGRPWEDHTLVCDVCKEPVPATDKHTHEIQVKGQLKFREVKENA
ncbi:hypothetical protein [Streptomyces sp. NPDC093149]|uniref:hypothetical protein n=1 Tax=Streptomyces sp. NPDC093149 TaxID=3366031 RepID=UPI00381E4D92